MSSHACGEPSCDGSCSPAPAPGQRWSTTYARDNTTYDVVGWNDDALVFICRPVDGFMAQYGDQMVSRGTFAYLNYLGPTPGYVPSPATPTPAAAPPTVAGVGPPAGYVPCERDCGRHTYVGGGERPVCWTCHLEERPQCRTAAAVLVAAHPDWTPPAAPPTREQILAEELRAKAKLPKCLGPHICNWGHAEDCPLYTPGQKPTEAQERQIATIVRVRAHQLAEGGPSATREAPGKAAPPPFVPSVDEWDLLPDADAAPVRYRRPAPCTCCGGVEYGSRVCPLCGVDADVRR